MALRRSICCYLMNSNSRLVGHVRACWLISPCNPFHSYNRTQSQLHSNYVNKDDDDYEEQGLDFPGGRVSFTSELRFIPESAEKRLPCYRVLDDDGRIAMHGSSVDQVLSEDLATKMYGDMVRLEMMDKMLWEAQRQGRISFYINATGEEAANIASAAALSPHDIVFPQYREAGVLLWRGYTLRQFVDQCFGNKADLGKGRQMPVHYGSNKHNYFTVSSPLSTQLPQAVGAAYSLKMDKKDACVAAFFGDGSSSEGDCHAGLNFAAVLDVPLLFICRNNGWAISTPIEEQFRSDGIVVKGQAYGIPSIRVDGNDTLAVYNVVRAAREMTITEQRPILIEVLTYRVGHHSTSDDSTKYRPASEIDYWKMLRNPVGRFRKWVERNGWWNDKAEVELRSEIKKQLLEAIEGAEKTEKPELGELFRDVYYETPQNLKDQEKLLRESITKHPHDYPPEVPI